jgi:membrane protease YdiL (CAAX protease family)
MNSDSDESATARKVLSSHILSASVVMIGVSTTLIGLVKVAKAHIGPTRADQYAALIGLLFLFSALASYSSIRWSEKRALRQTCDRIADFIFICALVGISIVASFLAYEFI